MNDDNYSVLEVLAYLHISESALSNLVRDGKIHENEYRIDCMQTFKKEEIHKYANSSEPEKSYSDVNDDYDWNCFLSMKNDIVAWLRKHIVINNTTDLVIFLLCTVSGVFGVFFCWKILTAVWWLGKLTICIIMAIIGTVYLFKLWRYIIEDVRMHE